MPEFSIRLENASEEEINETHMHSAAKSRHNAQQFTSVCVWGGGVHKPTAACLFFFFFLIFVFITLTMKKVV